MRIDLSGYSITDLKNELQRRGYYTENLWSDYDVQRAIDEYNEENNTNFSLSDEQKMIILDNVLGENSDQSSINESIDDEVENEFKRFLNLYFAQ